MKRRASKYAIFLIVFGTTFLSSPQANAVVAYSDVTCANQSGTEQTYQIGWDNSQRFFEGKGYIPRLFCEGGYAPPGFTIYVRDNLSDSSTGYYNGVVPTPIVNPIPEPTPSPSPTVTETATVQDTETVVDDSSTAVVSPSETETVPSESSTPTIPVETPTESTTPSDTSVVTDTSTVVSEPIVPEAPVEAPVVPPTPPAVQPDPIPQPQPEPQPDPVPENPEPPVEEEPVAPDEELPVEEPVPEEPTIDEEPSPLPEEEEQPSLPDEPEIEEESELEPEPLPEPIVESEIETQPDVTPEPPVVIASNVDLTTLAPNTPVQLDNGVILTAEVVVALQLLENPAELLSELFSDPGAVLMAVSNIGADMSPEVREKSEDVVVAAVIVGNIATQAAATAAGVAAYRRKP